MTCNRRFKTAGGEDREEVAFIDCTALGRQAEVIAQFCAKGKPLFVEGRLKYDHWDDKLSPGDPDGVAPGARKRSKLTVIVENFQFIGSRDAHAQQPGEVFDSANQRRSQQRQSSRTRPDRPQKSADESPVSKQRQFAEADIPF